MEQRTKPVYISGLEFTLVSDVDNGEILDTEVFIQDEFLLVITGERIDDFVTDLRQLFDKYRI